MEENEESEKLPDLSYNTLLTFAKLSREHPFFEVFLANGFLNLNIRKMPNRFRRVTEQSPAIGFPHLESRVRFKKEDYVCYERTDEEEAAFNILGISRSEACKQILEANIDEVFGKIWPEFEKALMSEDFFNYLREKNYVNLEIPFKDFQEKIELIKSQNELLAHYLEYAIEEKRVDNGWPSPAMFEMLARINKFKLQAWKLLPNGKLVIEEKNESNMGAIKEGDQRNDIVEKKPLRKINIMYLEGNKFGQIEFLNLCWKVHVSLSHSSNNIQAAWDEIIDLALLHGVRSCKVVVLEKQSFPAYQWGKEITLYCPPENINWQVLLTDITRRFVRRGIQPNYIALNDEIVFGSSFFSVRNDEDVTGRYMPTLKAINSNPSNQPMPIGLRKIKIECNQPKLKERERIIFNFYQTLMGEIENTSRKLLQSLNDGFKKIMDLDVEFPIWQAPNNLSEKIFGRFDEKSRKALIEQINVIQAVHSIVLDDLAGMSEGELLKKEGEYSALLANVITLSDKIISDKKSRDEQKAREADQAVESVLWTTPTDSPTDSPRNKDGNVNNSNN